MRRAVAVAAVAAVAAVVAVVAVVALALALMVALAAVAPARPPRLQPRSSRSWDSAENWYVALRTLHTGPHMRCASQVDQALDRTGGDVNAAADLLSSWMR
ncbi:MAG: hypothetical protein ACK4NM_18640 [Hydrogenophaga sp.]